jgi:hypothetical protein
MWSITVLSRAQQQKEFMTLVAENTMFPYLLFDLNIPPVPNFDVLNDSLTILTSFSSLHIYFKGKNENLYNRYNHMYSYFTSHLYLS